MADADKDKALAHLRYAKPLRVKDFRLDVVAAALEFLKDKFEVALRRSLDQAADILRDKDLRLDAAQEPRVLEKEVIRSLLRITVRLDLAPSRFTLAGGRE